MDMRRRRRRAKMRGPSLFRDVGFLMRMIGRLRRPVVLQLRRR